MLEAAQGGCQALAAARLAAVFCTTPLAGHLKHSISLPGLAAPQPAPSPSVAVRLQILTVGPTPPPMGTRAALVLPGKLRNSAARSARKSPPPVAAGRPTRGLGDASGGVPWLRRW